MSQRHSRREFLRDAAFTSFSVLAASEATAQDTFIRDRKVNFACVGVGGKGESDTADAARLGNLVAICDVDANNLAAAAKKYPGVVTYSDYRKMLAEAGSRIDAVTVSTPDHHHAHAAIRAMEMGKHCFCQKPLTHSLYEARKMAAVAHRKRVATQMGNQGTAETGLRRSVAQVRAGAIGVPREVHIWTDCPIWPQGIERPAPAAPPSTLDWEMWLGPAPERPYAPGYAPFAWRGWWDFGTGALGDMACHTMNMPFRALDLRYPIAVQAQSGPNNHDSYPAWSEIKYEFAATPLRPAITLTWYDGGHKPDRSLVGTDLSGSGSLIVGDKGRLYTPGDYGEDGHLIDGVKIADVTVTESPGHFEEFVRAIQGGPAAMSNFPEWASPLTETVLLGNLAVWGAGKRIEWDARRLRATNAPEVMAMVHPKYRAGYRI